MNYCIVLHPNGARSNGQSIRMARCREKCLTRRRERQCESPALACGENRAPANSTAAKAAATRRNDGVKEGARRLGNRSAISTFAPRGDDDVCDGCKGSRSARSFYVLRGPAQMGRPSFALPCVLRARIEECRNLANSTGQVRPFS